MKQHEILTYALKGVCVSMSKEEEVAKRYKEQYGFDDVIANKRMAKLQNKFRELTEMIKEIEMEED